MNDYSKEIYAIRGAAMKVHATLGCGFTEYVYQDALEVEFQHLGIPYEREKHLTVHYRDVQLAHDFYADFICYGSIIVELKAVTEITDMHKAQVINYLRITDLDVGLVMNFGQGSLQSERVRNLKNL